MPTVIVPPDTIVYSSGAAGEIHQLGVSEVPPPVIIYCAGATGEIHQLQVNAYSITTFYCAGATGEIHQITVPTMEVAGAGGGTAYITLDIQYAQPTVYYDSTVLNIKYGLPTLVYNYATLNLKQKIDIEDYASLNIQWPPCRWPPIHSWRLPPWFDVPYFRQVAR